MPLAGIRVGRMFEKSEPTCCFSHSSAVNSKQGMRKESRIVIVTAHCQRGSISFRNRHNVVKQTKTEGQKILGFNQFLLNRNATLWKECESQLCKMVVTEYSRNLRCLKDLVIIKRDEYFSVVF